jgi:hypothetical protein
VLHFVKIGACIDGETDHLCECVNFYQKIVACPHSYVLKYGKPTLVDVKHTKKAGKKMTKGEVQEYKKTTKMMYKWTESGFI